MSETWGKGAKNNTVGYGQGACNNTVGWGQTQKDSSVAQSWSGDTDISGCSGGAALAQIDNIYSMQFLRADTTQFNVPTTSDFAFGTGGFTISFWINFNIKHFTSTLLDFRLLSVLNNQPSLSFGLTNGVEWRRQGASPAVLPINIPASEFTVGNWNNIVVSNNGSTTKFYLDGVEKGSTADSVNYNQSCPLTVGQNIAGGNFWTSAKFDEIGIFNVALTEAEILSIYNATAVVDGVNKTADLSQLTTPPVAWYRM